MAFVARAPLLNSLFSLTIRRVSDRKYMYSSYSFIQNQEENDTTLERERERGNSRKDRLGSASNIIDDEGEGTGYERKGNDR